MEIHPLQGSLVYRALLAIHVHEEVDDLASEIYLSLAIGGYGTSLGFGYASAAFLRSFLNKLREEGAIAQSLVISRIGSAWASIRMFRRSELYHKLAIKKILAERFSIDDLDMALPYALCCNNVALALMEQGKYSEATSYAHRAYEVRLRHLRSSDLDLLATSTLLVGVYMRDGKVEQAHNMILEAISTLESEGSTQAPEYISYLSMEAAWQYRNDNLKECLFFLKKCRSVHAEHSHQLPQRETQLTLAQNFLEALMQPGVREVDSQVLRETLDSIFLF